MRTLPQGSVIITETEVKRSRFITRLARTDSEEAARTQITAAHTAFPDARHHCNAYIVRPDGLNPLMHSSDDGEPAGTAGTPMLDVLRHHDLENVTAVVTRYFGGTLLGTGGLVRAYSGAVQAALAEATLVTIRELTRFAVSVPLARAGKVESELRSAGWRVVDTRWASDLTVEIAADPEQYRALDSLVSTLIQEQPTIHNVGTLRVEVDTADL